MSSYNNNNILDDDNKPLPPETTRHHIKVHVTQASIDSEPEKLSIHSNTSNASKYTIEDRLKRANLDVESNEPAPRRHSMPAFALDKMKSLLSHSNNHSLEPGESLLSRRKKSLIGLFNTIGSNLGLVSPKRSFDCSLNGSSGSVDLGRMRHSLGILEMRLVPNNSGGSNRGGPILVSANNNSSIPGIVNHLGTQPVVTSVDEIYYRPHRSFLRDLLCCVCFKKHDEYDNLIESHSCARIFTALVLLTIACMLVGYIIKAARENTELNQSGH